MKQKFEIVYLTDHHNRGLFIFARKLNFTALIKIHEGALLNDILVYHYLNMYPILDSEGQPQFDIYVFRPVLTPCPDGHFRRGQIVDILNPD
jgi:hypothetical protein